MLICGLKLTHDAGVAVIERDISGNTSLLFSWEIEKLGNRPRYSELLHLSDISAILSANGLTQSDLDCLAVDGWGYADRPGSISYPGGPTLKVGAYHESDPTSDVYADVEDFGPLLGPRPFRYKSYSHVAGHLSAAYCTSPFALAGAPSYVLVWDAAIFPRLYHVDPGTRAVRFLRPLFPILGALYARFSSHFEPFRPPHRLDWPVANLGARGSTTIQETTGARSYSLSVPGKVMAFTALGSVDENLRLEMSRAYEAQIGLRWATMDAFIGHIAAFTTRRHIPTTDILATFQQFLGDLLLQGLSKALRRLPPPHNLCYSGGAALNIVWNSALRAGAVSDALWIPPFPNDSGGALGAACSALIATNGPTPLAWNVHSGPPVLASSPPRDWTSRPCSPAQLGQLLAEYFTPVVVLQGKAELGPRALGGRSVLCAATSFDSRDILNRIKQRESYRPISPICLEEDAPEVFDPGSPEPFMLYQHYIRPHWRDRIPSIVHVDGSARLQTISRSQDPVIAEVLASYRAATGIPVLCNTSANLPGCGFFPDVASAASWGQVRRIWSEGTLHEGPTAKGAPQTP
jgi:carbamoyltransferase